MSLTNIINHTQRLALFLLFSLSCLSAQEEEAAPTLHQALDEFDALFPTLKSIQSSYMLDGGTRSLEVEDSKGKSFSLCLDNSNVTFLVQYEDPDVNIEEATRQRLVYLHAKYPAQKGAIPVPFKGREEEEIKTKLRQFIEFNPQLAKSIEVFLHEMDEERLKDIDYQSPPEIDLSNSQPTGDPDNLQPAMPKLELPSDLDFNTTP